MTCEVCHQSFDENDVDLTYCAQCGWPLGRLNVQFLPDALTLAGSRPVPFRMVCRNVGHGRLRCQLGELPPGVGLAPSMPREWVLTTETQELALEADPNAIDLRSTELMIVLSANDKPGQHRYDLRPPCLDAGLQEHRSILPVSRRRLGPVHVYQEMLLFRTSQREQRLQVQNLGDVDVRVDFAAKGDYQLRLPGGKGNPHLSVPLGQGKQSEEILVESLGPGDAGTLRVEVADLPECSRDVYLCWVPEGSPEEIKQKWIIGIDFGTAKTAVFVSNCYMPRAHPVPVQWVRPDGKRRIKVPSVIEYSRNRPMPNFGWDVRVTAELDEGNEVVRSIKKWLTEDRKYTLPNAGEATAEQVVKDCIRFILCNVRKQEVFQGQPDPFEDALVVMSLPVHDQDQRYEEQKERTLRAAVAAGLQREKIACYPEPECAAVDFLRRKDELGLAVQDGQLMCIFDGGGGTTDICVLQIHLNHRETSFTRRALVGFPFGGDVLDELLVQYFLGQWQQAGILEKHAPDFAEFALRNDNQRHTRLDLINEVRSLKERLVFPDPEQPTVAMPTAARAQYSKSAKVELEITWDVVDRLFSPYIQQMLQTGFTAEDIIPDWRKGQPEGRKIGMQLPSLINVLWAQGIDPTAIKWLCLTGGNSFIPSLVGALQYLLPNASLIPPVSSLSKLSNMEDSPLTLNVAQGAATRPLFTVEGQLQADYFLQFSLAHQTSPERQVLARGDAPGKIAHEQAFVLGPNEGGTLRLIAQVGSQRGAVYALPVLNTNRQEAVNVLAQVEYGTDQKVCLKVQLVAPGQAREVLSKTAVVE